MPLRLWVLEELAWWRDAEQSGHGGARCEGRESMLVLYAAHPFELRAAELYLEFTIIILV